MAHILPWKKYADGISYVAKMFFQEITWLHGIPWSITFDRDIKFVSHFGKYCGSIWTQPYNLATPTTPKSIGKQK